MLKQQGKMWKSHIISLNNKFLDYLWNAFKFLWKKLEITVNLIKSKIKLKTRFDCKSVQMKHEIQLNDINLKISVKKGEKQTKHF